MDEALARSLVEQHLAGPAETVERSLVQPAEVVVRTTRAAWAVRDVRAVELLLPPTGLHVAEARRVVAGPPSRPHGFAVLPDGSAHHLNERRGLEAFLRRADPRPEPLSIALLLVRYHAPEALGEWPVRLVTRAEDVHPALAAPAQPLGLAVNGARIVFTTEFRSPAGDGRLRLGLDRWAVALDADGRLSLDVEELRRAFAEGAA